MGNVSLTVIISIHVLRMEDDVQLYYLSQFKDIISIHVLRMEDDLMPTALPQRS